MKHTALFEEHQKLGGKLIDFGEWKLPVQYSGIMDEHLTCRGSAGLFDVSHMGEVHIEGPLAEAYLNFLVTNQVSKLSVGQAQYTVMCQPNGGIIDDLVIYKRASDRFLAVVNASNTEKDFQHMLSVQTQNKAFQSGLVITNESSQYTQIAIQGRKASKILQALTQDDLKSIKTYWFTEGKVLNHIPAIIARTGYTGEDGFEIYVEWKRGAEVWRALLESGASDGIKPCGLGARDTLRMEMKYPLYGNELTTETNPLEAGLGWVVKLDKKDFLGKAALLQIKEKGLKRKLVGLKPLDPGIPRQGYTIFDEQGKTALGQITSGTLSPSLKFSVAIGYVEAPFAEIGQRLTFDLRGKKIPIEVVSTPFYKRPY